MVDFISKFYLNSIFAIFWIVLFSDINTVREINYESFPLFKGFNTASSFSLYSKTYGWFRASIQNYKDPPKLFQNSCGQNSTVYFLSKRYNLGEFYIRLKVCIC